MSNIADLIEKYILYRMANEQDTSRVVLKRNEIAEEIACAPSQITYVLSTRFTNERGFQVESRRGSGGFIQITRAQEDKSLIRELMRRMDEDTPLEEIDEWLHLLTKRREIEPREAALMKSVMRYAYKAATPTARVELMQSMLYTLENC